MAVRRPSGKTVRRSVSRAGTRRTATGRRTVRSTSLPPSIAGDTGAIHSTTSSNNKKRAHGRSTLTSAINLITTYANEHCLPRSHWHLILRLFCECERPLLHRSIDQCICASHGEREREKETSCASQQTLERIRQPLVFSLSFDYEHVVMRSERTHVNVSSSLKNEFQLYLVSDLITRIHLSWNVSHPISSLWFSCPSSLSYSTGLTNTPHPGWLDRRKIAPFIPDQTHPQVCRKHPGISDLFELKSVYF